MTVNKTKQTLLLPVLLALFLVSVGCVSLSERISPGWLSAGANYYVGTHVDCFCISANGATTVGMTISLIDLPFSFALDTILLPVDFIGNEMDQPNRPPVENLNCEMFRTVFAPTRFRENCYHYYHGDRDGIAYVSFMEFTNRTTFWNHSGRIWHRWRIPIQNVELPRSFPFSGWENREYFDIFGDLAYLEVARCQLQAGAPPAMIKAVAKFPYQPVSIPNAPTGTWAFVATTLEGKNLRVGYLYAPGFSWEQGRDTIDAHGLLFKAYPYRIDDFAGIETYSVYNPQNHTAAWLKDWYGFMERP